MFSSANQRPVLTATDQSEAWDVSLCHIGLMLQQEGNFKGHLIKSVSHNNVATTTTTTRKSGNQEYPALP